MKRLTISKLVVASLSAIIVATAMMSYVLYAEHIHIISTLNRTLLVDEPISAAAYEMEINAIGTILAAIKYRENQLPEFRQRLKKDAGDFAKFYATYQSLAVDKESIALGKHANQLYLEIKTLAINMMDKADADEALSNKYYKQADSVEYLIERALLSDVYSDTSKKSEKILALHKLDGHLHGINDAMALSLRNYKPNHQKTADAYAAKFKAELASIRLLDISPAQQKITFDIQHEFEQAMLSKSQMMVYKVELAQQVSKLIKLRTVMDDILDDEVQRLSKEQLESAKTEAYQSLRKFKLFLMLLLPIVVLVSIVVGVFLLRMIKQPISSLIDSAAKLGEGDLTHRIHLSTHGEFAKLGEAINHMAENLQTITTTTEEFEISENLLKLSNASLQKQIKQLDEQDKLLRQMVHYDSLTNLPNRQLFSEKLQTAIADADNYNSSLAVLLMDLDNFKEVNGTLGHQQGDELLRLVAKRLTDELSESDTAARLGGDEFAMLILASDDVELTLMLEDILRVFKKPFALGDCSFDISASIGVATFPKHGNNISDLMRCADIAMYAAKKSRASYRFYSTELAQNTAGQMQLVGELSDAIRRSELALHYQPVIDIDTNKIISAEALVRWNHPIHGLLMPDTFIMLAESSGAIVELTFWVLEEAIRQGKAWLIAGIDCPIAVNLSMISLHIENLPEKIHKLLQDYELPPANLSLELTESVVMSDSNRGLIVLNRLSDMGLGLAIDDFGTGYSSFSYLSHMPVQHIKIDKSFTLDMLFNKDNEAIVCAIINLSYDMRLKVIAEGVENAETLDKLTDLGCDAVQGYYFSKPITAPDFEVFARTSEWAIAQPIAQTKSVKKTSKSVKNKSIMASS